MSSRNLRIALDSLRANRVRTGLTTLGIIIGVASITLVLSLGEGARQAVAHQVDSLGGNIIVIKPGQSGFQDFGAYNPYSTAITTTLTEHDFETTRSTAGVGSVAPVMFLSGSVRSADQTAHSAPIIATNEKIADILHLKLTSGQFFNKNTSRHTVVIGQQLAIELYGTDQAMGQEITIKGRTHTVIGIVKNTKRPINLSGIDLDHAVYMSLEQGKSFNQGIAQIQQLNINAKSSADLDSVAKNLDATMLKNHQNERDFTILAGKTIASDADGFFGSILTITSIVAAIAIIVGGIGIMNIMLVSVTERTREIGIRKAVGATDGQIIRQFLIEALVMSTSGGIIGLVIAYALAFLIGSQLFFQPVLSWQIIVSALGMALLVGVIFGIYPAIKAARNNTIEALRQYQ
jgi:ABC-type antimicrobial peptide transport system permease subunit